jgi:hypothetical protein
VLDTRLAIRQSALVTCQHRCLRHVLSLALTSVLALAPACTHDDSHAGAVSASSTTDAVAVPPLCTPPKVVASVQSFLDAVNDRDLDHANASIADSPTFVSFAVNPERFDESATNRSTLRAFLKSDVVDGRRMELLEFNTFYNADNGTGDFNFRLRQTLSDGTTTVAIGKGATDCGTALIVLWTVGPREPSN